MWFAAFRVHVASRELDITDDVLAELNSALPSLSLSLP